MKTLAIIPGFNVASHVGGVVCRVPRGEVDLVLVVDDGSTDDTSAAARQAGAEVIRHELNRGVGAAIRTGITYARDHGFEAVVVLNAIGKFDPAHVGTLLQPLRDGTADLVQGSRFVAGGSHHGTPLKRRIGTRGYSLVFSTLLGHSVSDASSGIRAFRTSVTNAHGIDLNQRWLDRYELEPYLLWKTIECGHRVVEVPMRVEYPAGPRSAYTRMRPVHDWWHLVRPLVTLTFERVESGLKRRR
jgi:glycosyltransferase involved in cell wall biosynthesis